ncbi:hypothetical protein Syun_027292 [Stephania yunnanensis]|uniref:Uncharacterized protein n=1 Tax=Stephania yunnanensis TaxID=152371 RepID=A0AAP0EFE2_9MAGN
MVDSFISKRVWSLPCWDLTETSKRDDGIDLLKDKQALQRLTETAEKAKMDLSSLTQTNISLPFITATADGPKHIETTIMRVNLRSCVLTSSTEENYFAQFGFMAGVSQILTETNYQIAMAVAYNTAKKVPLLEDIILSNADAFLLVTCSKEGLMGL